MVSRELRRIDLGPAPGEASDGLLIRVEALTTDPLETLSRIRDVLRVILTNMGGTSVVEWTWLLPAWFVAACGPEPTPKEADDALERGRGDPQGEEDEAWSLFDFLYWFEPEMRSWWWWEGRVEGSDRLTITIVVEGHPFADGALRWLLRAAGARAVTVGI